MTTEQYQIGYEAGYSDGFDAALAQPAQPSQSLELSDEDLQPAVDAWFNEYIYAGRYPFAKRMRAAIAAINAKGAV